MLDFRLTDDLDIVIDLGKYGEQVNNITTVMTAFFTDSRVSGKRGYWLDITSSELWLNMQTRVSELSAKELTESTKSVAAELVEQGVFSRIDADVTSGGGQLTLNIKCYDNGQLVEHRKFNI
jgi:phage gp46-like protein